MLKTLNMMQVSSYIDNTTVICDQIKFTTLVLLLFANFNLCTIGSSMFVKHEGTVYSERCYRKKTTFSMCFLDFFVHFTVWKKGKFVKESTDQRFLSFFLLYSIFLMLQLSQLATSQNYHSSPLLSLTISERPLNSLPFPPHPSPLIHYS